MAMDFYLAAGRVYENIAYWKDEAPAPPGSL